MRKITVIYWSGTGNTQKMASAVAEGARMAGAGVQILEVDKALREDVMNADAVALGCPAMGTEVLEEDEMEPFISSLEKENLQGLNLALFGSYDWGDGEWMREWEERMKKTGACLVDKGLIIQLEPDTEGLAKCWELGDTLARLN
jgi:flavodoxin short chain